MRNELESRDWRWFLADGAWVRRAFQQSGSKVVWLMGSFDPTRPLPNDVMHRLIDLSQRPFQLP